MDYKHDTIYIKKETYDNLVIEVKEAEFKVKLAKMILKRDKSQVKKTLTVKQQYQILASLAASTVVYVAWCISIITSAFTIATPILLATTTYMALASGGLLLNIHLERKNVKGRRRITYY